MSFFPNRSDIVEGGCCTMMVRGARIESFFSTLMGKRQQASTRLLLTRKCVVGDAVVAAGIVMGSSNDDMPVKVPATDL